MISQFATEHPDTNAGIGVRVYQLHEMLTRNLRPALWILRGELGEGGRAGSSKVRQMLVVGEVALSLMLLVSTMFLVRSFRNLLDVDPGFEQRNVLAFTVSLSGERYEATEAMQQFYQQVEERVASLPGVEAAGWVNSLPFSTSESWRGFALEGRPEHEPGQEPIARYRVVSPEYFETLRISQVSGRFLAATDRADGLPVAVVDRSFVERFLPDGEALGQRLRVGSSEVWHEIVGVVESVHHNDLTEGEEPSIYLPLGQRVRAQMTLALRAAGPPQPLLESIRREVQAIDPAQPIFHVTTLENLVAESRLAQTAAMSMMAAFAALALGLTALGLYGVLASMVTQGRREIGLRMALGAGLQQVLGGVLREALALVAVGCVVGLAGAWGISQLLASLLYGLSPGDLGTYLLALPLLALVALLACLVPALRATRLPDAVLWVWRGGSSLYSSQDW